MLPALRFILVLTAIHVAATVLIGGAILLASTLLSF
jgi:hypothetical protein